MKEVSKCSEKHAASNKTCRCCIWNIILFSALYSPPLVNVDRNNLYRVFMIYWHLLASLFCCLWTAVATAAPVIVLISNVSYVTCHYLIICTFGSIGLPWTWTYSTERNFLARQDESALCLLKCIYQAPGMVSRFTNVRWISPYHDLPCVAKMTDHIIHTNAMTAPPSKLWRTFSWFWCTIVR